MATKFKNAADLKYYLYVSDAKLAMLYKQIASSTKDKKSLEWGIDWKAFKFTRKTEAEDEPDQDDKLTAVIQAIEDYQLVGTIDEPNEYIKGVLPMRWGLLKDAGRPTDEAPLVFFGGRQENITFGLGGSSRHVAGNYGCSATGSRSAIPYLIAHLLQGLDFSYEGWQAAWEEPDSHDYETCIAVSLAVDHLKGPEQNLEFYAKTLLQGRFHDPYTTRKDLTTVILASPIYVAMSSPYPKELDSY